MLSPMTRILKTARCPMRTVALGGESGPEAQASPPVPLPFRFLGVPFLEGPGPAVAAIHLCPARVHLGVVREGGGLELYNRLELAALDLEDAGRGRSLRFRPAINNSIAEVALLGPEGAPVLSRWDLGNGCRLPSLPFQGASVLEYSLDGRFLAAGGEGGLLQVWHLGGEAATTVLRLECGARVEALCFHPEHPTLYALLEGGVPAAFELAPGHAASVPLVLVEQAPGVGFTHLAAGPGSYALHLAGDDGRVYVVDTVTGDVGAFHPEVGPILGLEVLPSSGCLCVRGRRSVYLAPSRLAVRGEHLALRCPFACPLYAAWELGRDALLVFHAAEAP